MKRTLILPKCYDSNEPDSETQVVPMLNLPTISVGRSCIGSRRIAVSNFIHQLRRGGSLLPTSSRRFMSAECEGL
jgi:hypothetical protein